MVANNRRDIEDIELNSGSVHRSFIYHGLGEGDINGNQFGVRLFRSGEPANIGGASCIGYFIRHTNGDTVVINGGTFSGNEAWVTLPQACYAYEGEFTLIIQLVGGGITGTMRIVDGTVINSLLGQAVDPGSVIPSLDSLMAVIARAEAAANTIAGISIRTEQVEGNIYRGIVSKT